MAINVEILVLGLFITMATLSRSQITELKISGRIVGGSNAYSGEFPYFVSLIEINKLRHICGGTIISHRHILTAAHCMINHHHIPNSVAAILAVTHPDHNVVVKRIAEIHMHANYTHELFLNDIALLKTLDEILFSLFIQPIALPRANVAAQQTATLCGLGSLNYARSAQNRVVPKSLQYQRTVTIATGECKARYGALYDENVQDWLRIHRLLTERVFCAMAAIDMGPCNGDSGGPLVFNNTIVGIVSTTIGCALGYPDIFTNVYEYRDWIVHGQP